MQRRRLQRAQLTEKRTYKMYKKGRLWLIAGLSTFTLGASLLPMTGRADTTSTTAEQQGRGQRQLATKSHWPVSRLVVVRWLMMAKKKLITVR